MYRRIFWWNHTLVAIHSIPMQYFCGGDGLKEGRDEERERGREGETERRRKVVEEGVGGLGRIDTFLKVSTDDSNDMSPSALSVALSTSFHTLPSSRCPIPPGCCYPPVLLLLLLSGPLPIPSKLGFLPPPLPLLGGEKRLVTLQTPWHGGGDGTSSLPQQSEIWSGRTLHSGNPDLITIP